MSPWRVAFTVFAVSLIVAMLSAVYYVKSKKKTFRYRLTVEIEIEGRQQSAASVIEVDYIYPLFGKFEFVKWQTRVRGVAPMFDLGSQGTLIAALEPALSDLTSRQTPSKSSPIYRLPYTMADIPLGAYHLPDPQNIMSVRGKVELDTKFYPIFVWIPPSNDWRLAKQMFHDEIKQRGPEALIAKITVEPAAGLPLKTKIEPAPTWLEEARAGQAHGVTTPAGAFVLNVYAQLEH